MQSSRCFQWRLGSPGQSDSADSRSYLLLLLLLLLLLRAAHDCSGVGGISREAESEDAIVDTVVGRYDSNIAVEVFIVTSASLYIGQCRDWPSCTAVCLSDPAGIFWDQPAVAVVKEKPSSIRRWLIKWLD